MEKWKNRCFEFMLFFGLLIRVSAAQYPYNDKGTWLRSTCSGKILGLVELPNSGYFSGSLIEIVNEPFGPSLYFRSNTDCSSYFFAVPLPFSICSMTYVNGQFFVIRDDVEDGTSTLYTIKDYDLIGGYLFWLQQSDLQCRLCSSSQLPPTFDLNNQQPSCGAFANSTVVNSICAIDLDILFAKQRLSISIDVIRENGYRIYQELLRKFELVHTYPSYVTLLEKSWHWMNWHMYSHFPNRFTSVHKLELLDYLLVNQPNFKYMQIMDHLRPPVALTVKPDTSRYITMTSFEYGGVVTLVCIDFDGILHIIDYTSGRRIKIGSLPYAFRQLFVFGNSMLVGLDASNNVFSSSDYIKDVLVPQLLCGLDSTLPSGECYVNINLPTPFTRFDAQETCTSMDGTYREGNPISSPTTFTIDNDWISHSNGRNYYISYHKLSYMEAEAYCHQFSNDDEASHLAIVDTDEVFETLLPKLNENFPTNSKKMWIGGYLNRFSVWMWNDGTEIEFGRNVTASGSANCLSLSGYGSQNSMLIWSPLLCSNHNYFICEKYQVCWDFVPNTVLNLNEFAKTTDGENLPYVFNFGKIDISSKNPVQECANFCQQNMNQSCVAFTYSNNGDCFGINKYLLYDNATTSSMTHTSGFLQQCHGTYQLSARKELPILVNCTVTDVGITSEVFSVFCPPGCLSVDADVFGTSYYTEDSSICRAAIHDAQISDLGGHITIYRRTGSISFSASSQNGIVSSQSTEGEFAFVFDRSFVIPYQQCATQLKFLKKCAPDSASSSMCLSRGCCAPNKPGYPSCIFPLPTGPKFTGDRWLKSPYSSYQYAVIYTEERTDMPGARRKCQAEGGELAYAGLLDKLSYRYLHDNVIYHEYADAYQWDKDSIWIGIIDKYKNESYVGLNGKSGNYFDWFRGEPNVANFDCVVVSKYNNQMWGDVQCTGGLLLHNSLCQRISSRCDIALESIMPCNENVPFNASKLECIANGCCYNEPLDGNDICFKGIQEKTSEYWWASPFNEYEYTVIEVPPGWEEARLACMDRGGDLAYAGMTELSTYQVIYDNYLSLFSALYGIMWFGLHDLVQEGVYVDLEGRVSNLSYYASNEPTGGTSSNCIRIHTATGLWLDSGCKMDVPAAVCQRFKGKTRKEYWWSSSSDDYEYRVLEVPSTWNDARLACMNIGGDLASAGLGEFSTYQIIYHNIFAFYSHHNLIWIGVNDRAEENAFVDLYGRRINMNNFAYNEPNGSTHENCVSIRRSATYWADCSCNILVDATLCQRIKEKINEEYWWRSPFSGYEYTVIEAPSGISWDDARLTCMDKGGDLAYSGMTDDSAYYAIYDNYVSLFSHVGSLWIGINDQEEEGTFVGLDGIEINWTNFNITEPNGTVKNCAVVVPTGKWYNFGCNNRAKAALCQRNKGENMGDKWWKAPFNNYEYTVIQSSLPGFDQARQDCKRKGLGADLGYAGLTESSTHELIFDKVVSLYPDYRHMWIGINYLSGGNFVDLNGTVASWTNFENNMNGGSSCVQILSDSGNWIDTACSNDVDAVLCQRLAVQTFKKESILCETLREEMCMKYGDQCHENASCVDHMTWFECVCHEGFVGDGEVCVPTYNCPDGWMKESTGCYFLKIAAVSFFQAEQECQSMGAHLISIHSDKEYQLLKDLAQPHAVYTFSATHSIPAIFWIGLRRNIKLVSRNGEEYPGCGLWTDGTHCVYNQTTSGIRNHECFVYSTSEELWQENVCALRVHYASRQQITGFVCKQDRMKPQYIDVEMTSLSWDVYPGFAHMKVNGRAMPWEHVNATITEIGCIHITSLTDEGLTVNSHSVCNANEDDAKSELTLIASTLMKDPKERYVAIGSGGRININVWEHFYNVTQSQGITIPLQSHINQEYHRKIGNTDFDTEINPQKVIYKCDDCAGSCSGAAVFQNENGEITCRAYFPSGSLASQYVYTVAILEWTKIGQDKKEIIFRSKILKTFVKASRLYCPWLTEEVKGFGVNLVHIVDDDISRSSTASCIDPPCVQQIACKRPSRLETSVNYSPNGESFLIFCKKMRESLFYCPISKAESFFEGPLHASIQMPVTRDAMLATFDDLLFLGSPPFEYGSIYGPHNITWMPVQWTWTNDQYALIVTGINNRAIRFQSEEVHTLNDICWWNLDDSNMCPHGLTIGFWYRIVSWSRTEDQLLINTGAWGNGGTCSGAAVYVNMSSYELVVMFKSLHHVWLDSHSIQLQKWTHVLFIWNATEQTLTSHVDGVPTNTTIYGSAVNAHDLNANVLCDTSKFSIGSNRSGNGVFDLDDLQVFSQALHLNEAHLSFTEWKLPIRHRFVGEMATITYQNSQTLTRSRDCNTNLKYYSCGLSDTCQGSVINCFAGFNLAFKVKFPNISSSTYSGSNEHIMLITNVPDDMELPKNDRSGGSFGFRISAVPMFIQSISSYLWKVSFRHTFIDDPAYQPEISWLVGSSTTFPFWLQFHPDGVWMFCFRWPTNCKNQTSLSMKNMNYYVLRDNETFNELSIGPIHVEISGTNIATSFVSNIEITNVWFNEKGYDLILFADEVNMLSQPLHWQPNPSRTTIYEGTYATISGYQFQLMGNAEMVRWTMNSVGGQMKFRNDATILRRYSDDGWKLKDAAGWLELSAESLLSQPCLYDIDNCNNGFTLQFFMEMHYRQTRVSGDDSYILSTGGQATPLSRGIAFYQSYQNENYYIIIATSHKVWNMSFIADLSSGYTLIRISWHNDIGLSLFINDVPVIRLTKWQPVVHPTLDDEAYHDYLSFDPFRAMTIGRRNDRFEGFAYFKFGEMLFWDSVVEGMPYQSIGRKCLPSWHQIGESCFLDTDATASSYAQAKQKCNELSAELAYQPSLPAYEAFNRYLKQSGVSFFQYWIGIGKSSNNEELLWDSLQLSLSTSNFNALANAGTYLASESYYFIGRKLSGILEEDLWYWDFVLGLFSLPNVICMAPLTQDPYIRGCYSANTALTSLGFDSSASFLPHNLMSTVPAKSLNSLGSYDIPHSCRRFCYTEYGSSVSLVAAYDCYCLDRDVSLSDISNIGSTLPSVYSCTSTNVSTGIDNLEYGYNVLNYKPGTFIFRYPPAHLYCGPIENGGLYKCGAEVASDLHAAVYAFSGILLNDTTLLPLSSISVSIANEVAVETFETIIIEITNIECCLNVDQVDGKTECECAESLISIHIDFGDNSKYEVYLMPNDAVGFKIQHFYENSGKYKLILNAQNFIGTEGEIQFVSKIHVLSYVEGPELNYVWLDVVEPGQLAEVTTLGLRGTYMYCRWNYGDGSAEETIHLQLLPIPKTYHRYQDPGEYMVYVKCSNRIQERNVSTLAVVHERITGLNAHSDAVVVYGEHYRHGWHISRGSHVECSVYFGNYSLTESNEIPSFNDTESSFYFSDVTNKGIAHIPYSLYMSSQTHNDSCSSRVQAMTYTMLVTCFNAVTEPTPFVITYVTLEVPINGFTAHIRNDKSFIKPDESICVEVNITEGSNIVLRWDWGDDDKLDQNIIEYCGHDECETRVACASYKIDKKYNITIDAMNSVSFESILLLFNVEIPVSQVNVQLVPALVALQPSEISIVHVLPLPTGMIQIDFGDGGRLYSAAMIFDVETNAIQLLHRYQRIGYYTITIYGHNNVSSFNVSTQIQVGLEIEDVGLTISSSRFVRCFIEPVMLTLQVTTGSELVYNIDFGDGSSQPPFNENSVRQGPDYPDVHTLHHIYEQPGNYVVSIEVENVFGAIEVNSDQYIVAQNPLRGSKFTLTSATMDVVLYPPGLATFDAYLIKNEMYDLQTPENIPDRGWANDVHIRWIHSTAGGNVELGQSYGRYDLDVFPANFTFTYAHIGEVTVYAEISNIVSSLILKYKFQVMEVVEGLQLEANNLENQQNNAIKDLKFEVVHVTVRHELTFVTHVVKGSHVSFKIDYGDGSIDLQSSPVLFAKHAPVHFAHSYEREGTYSINVTAFNEVGFMTEYFEASVFVYETIGNLTSVVSIVDIDEAFFELDIFKDSSELYVLAYNKPGIESENGNYYVPLNRPVYWHVGSLHGSNASVTCDFINTNVTVHTPQLGSTNSPTVSYITSALPILIVDGIANSDYMQLKFLGKLTSSQVELLGEHLRSKLDMTDYRAESTLLTRFLKPGQQHVKITVSNPVSSESIFEMINIEAVVDGISFDAFDPPIANRTSNITFSVKQVGTNSCFVLDPGDLSLEIAFGLSVDYCVGLQGINAENFYLLTEDRAQYTGLTFSYYNFSGDLSDGVAQLNFSLHHVYDLPSIYRVKLHGFNRVSHFDTFVDTVVTEILCDFPLVNIEKHKQNSVKSPRRILSFLEFRLYATICTNCKLTSKTVISWQAYSMTELAIQMLFSDDVSTENNDDSKFVDLPLSAQTFSSPYYRYKIIPGLIYTSKSEDITIKPRFLNLGLHLVCINVAMYGVDGIVTTDCIYIIVVLPPLVAGMTYGVRRAVGYDQLIDMNAAAASYDPDQHTLHEVENLMGESNPGNLLFMFTCPFLVDGDASGEADSDEIDLMFHGVSGWKNVSACDNLIISCDNSYHTIEVLTAQFLNSSNMVVNITHGVDVFKQVNTTCSGKTTCNVTLNEWVAEYLMTLFTNQTANDSYCIEVFYKCGIKQNSPLFDYISSNFSCIPSGYYPKFLDQSSETCQAITVANHTGCGKVQVNTGLLQYGLSYMVRVRVVHPPSGRTAVGSQILQISLGEPPTLRIDCLVNCNLKINARTTISVGVTRTNVLGEVISHNATSPISYTWTLLKVLNQTNKHNYSTDNMDLALVKGFEENTATGVHGIYFIFNPGFLLPATKYRVRVVGEIEGATPGLTEMELIPNLPPYNGNCYVTPVEGIAMNDTFTVICQDWKDEGINVVRSEFISPDEYTLGYQIYYQTSQDIQFELLSYGSESTVSGLFLPPGLAESDYRVWIQVRIIDEYGAQALVNLSVQVYEALDLSNEMLENLTQARISSSGSQNIAQISASVSGVLNVQSNISRGSGSSVAHISPETEQRASLRSQLLDAIVDKINTDSDLDGIQQSCGAISSLTAVPNEVSDVTQITAVDALFERTGSLSRLAETRAAEDVAETASTIVKGVDNVVNSARSQVLANSAVSDPHTSLVALPIFSTPAPVVQSSKLILDEEELYLSPEEREERRTELFTQKSDMFSKNNEQAMKVGTRAVSSFSSISGSLLKQKLPGEPAVTIKANGLTLDAQRNDPAELCRLLSLNETAVSSSSALTRILQSSHVDLENCNETNSEKSIDTEFIKLDDNPFVWDDSADYVRSSVVSLSFKFPNGSQPFKGSNSTFRLELPVKSSLSNVPPEEFNFIPSGVDRMSFHELNARQLDDVIFLTIQPISDYTDISDSESIHIRVYFLYTPNLKIFPTINNFTFVRELPDYTSDFPYRIRLDSSELPSLGRYVYGILQINDLGNITAESNMTLHNYKINNMVTSCRFWNETTQRWETSGCRVSDETSSKIVVCLCNHLTSFGADFLVAPNPIDFSALASKLANLKDNLAVLLTIIGLLVLYVIGLAACRRLDKKDILKWSVALLMDNNLCDTYFYQITVKTGSRRDAETSSKIFFHVSGDNADTSLRILASKKNTKLLRGSVRKFLMAVDEPLGVLSFVKIWHDNSGKDSMASWYLDHIIISDLQTKQQYYFFCDDWLAVNQSDGSVERILPVASEQQIGSFHKLFASSTKKDFSDGHLWFSLFSRPTKSHFTRVQRLTCAVAVLFSTMLASTMFYGKDEENEGQQGVLEIGPITLTMQQFIISIEAALIVIPINILLVQIFRRSRPKEDKVKGDESVRSAIRKSLDSIENAIDKEKDEKQGRGRKISFPYWAVYIAWVLAAVITLVSATFVFLYSVEWGAEKAQDWLLSIVFSFMQSVFVIQPAKVILVAIVLSFIVNRYAKERAGQMVGDVEETNDRKEDVKEFKKMEEDWLLQSPMDDELDVLRNHKTEVNDEKLAEARKKHMQHKVMIDTIHDVIAYILYVVLLLIAANSAKDPQAYRFHRSLSDVFLAEGEPPFEEMRTHTDFWDWCDNALIPGLHASPWYNGDRITWLQSRFISNRETFVAGPARIRQLRVKNGLCELPNDHTLVTRGCISSYNIRTQETSDFTSGWRIPTNFTTVTSPWTFQNFFDLGGFPYNGLMDLYDGGGYAVTLGNTARSSRKKLEILKDENWIDHHTAAVFIEFTVYNANVNLFGSVVLLLERSQNGAFFAYPTISPIRLYDFVDGKGYLLIVVYVIFLIVLLYNIIKIGKMIKLQKTKYFKDFWHVLDLISACLAVIAIALYALRHIHANNTLEKITVDVDKETFINFQYVVLWHDTFRFLVAFTLFLATVKFSKLLHFNRRIRLLALTLRHATVPVLYFSAMFGIYFIAFMFLANLWFEQEMYAYSSLYLTSAELFSMLLGRFDFTELKIADQVLGPLFFTVFTGLLTIALLNMFISILDGSIKKARIEVENEKNDFEVVEYIVKQISNYIYTKLPHFILPQPIAEDTEEEDGPVYIDYPEEVLELRIDTITKYVNKMESEFYASVTLEELEAELEEESDDYE